MSNKQKYSSSSERERESDEESTSLSEGKSRTHKFVSASMQLFGICFEGRRGGTREVLSFVSLSGVRLLLFSIHHSAAYIQPNAE